MKKQKILFVEPRYTSFYGAQKSMLHLIKTLDKDKFDCFIVTTKEGQLSKSLRENNANVIVIALGRLANTFGGEVLKYSKIKKMIVMLQVLFFNLKLFNLIRKKKIDQVYANDNRAVLYCGLAAKLSRKKLVLYVRSDISNTFMTRFSFKISDKIITIAHGVLKKDDNKFTEKYRNKIENIYTGFDINSFTLESKDTAIRTLDFPINKTKIGYVGSINERKGLEVLVSALADEELKRKTTLILVGDVSPGHEDYWEELKKFLEVNNIEYRHLGYVENISMVYSALDIKVLPSWAEGLPRSVIEAMIHKCPVIATDVGGVEEIISSSKYGIIVNKGSSEEIKKGLQKFVNNPQLRKDIGENSRKNVVDKFNQEKFAAKINDFFNNK